MWTDKDCDYRSWGIEGYLQKWSQFGLYFKGEHIWGFSHDGVVASSCPLTVKELTKLEREATILIHWKATYPRLWPLTEEKHIILAFTLMVFLEPQCRDIEAKRWSFWMGGEDVRVWSFLLTQLGLGEQSAREGALSTCRRICPGSLADTGSVPAQAQTWENSLGILSWTEASEVTKKPYFLW